MAFIYFLNKHFYKTRIGKKINHSMTQIIYSIFDFFLEQKETKFIHKVYVYIPGFKNNDNMHIFKR
jgi:hypothetical protein